MNLANCENENEWRNTHYALSCNLSNNSNNINILAFFNLSTRVLFTVEPGYNDNGLCDTSSIACDSLCYQLVRYVLPSVTTTLLYNDPQYSVPIITL
jgi:hypothetical protein